MNLHRVEDDRHVPFVHDLVTTSLALLDFRTEGTRVVVPLRTGRKEAFLAFTVSRDAITGVTAGDGSETLDRPAVFVVVTVNAKGLPLASPPIVHDVAVVAHAGPAGVGGDLVRSVGGRIDGTGATGDQRYD